MESNDSLTKLAVEKEKVRITLSEKEKRKKKPSLNLLKQIYLRTYKNLLISAEKLKLGQVRMIGLVKIEL
jgi:hypothetical protein